MMYKGRFSPHLRLFPEKLLCGYAKMVVKISEDGKEGVQSHYKTGISFGEIKLGVWRTYDLQD